MTAPDAFALTVIAIWPVIPLWWIPVHGSNRFVKKLGIAMYPIIFVMWVFSAYLIYTNRIFLLGFHIDFPLTIRVLGAFFAGAGIFLQLWTLKVLTARVITGVPELISGEKASLVIKGPFSFMRHPTYVSHTIFLVGVLLTTGVVSIGIVVIIDFFVVTLIIIPLEENDLLQRFGDEYSQYMSHTPGLFPRIEWKKLTGNKTNPTNSVNSSKLA